MVENAVFAQKQLNADNCSFLCVFDNDMRIDTKGTDLNRIQKAFDMAKDHGVNIIFSNLSFEYWALLHFKDTDAPMTQKEAINKLRKKLPTYEGKRLNYSLMKPNEALAIARAQKHRNYDKIPEKLEHVKDNPNPNTNADVLLDVILKFISEFTSI